MLLLIASVALYVLVIGLALWLFVRYMNEISLDLEKPEEKPRSSKNHGRRHTDTRGNQ